MQIARELLVADWELKANTDTEVARIENYIFVNYPTSVKKRKYVQTPSIKMLDCTTIKV